MQYMYIVIKYKIHLHSLWKRAERIDLQNLNNKKIIKGLFSEIIIIVDTLSSVYSGVRGYGV
jgi:hypothetical protein